VVATVACGGNDTTFSGPSGWTQATFNQPAGSATIETSIWYLIVDAGRAGQTSWTWTIGVSHSMYICIEEWTATNGWQVSVVDKTANGNTSGSPTTSTTIQSGTTATTTQAEELWIASLAYKGSAQSETSITTGWTKDLEATLASNNTMTMLYRVVNATGAAACQYTISSAQHWAGCVATFMSVTGTQTNKDVVIRGRVSQQVSKDVVMRGNIYTGVVAKDVTMRGNIGLPLVLYGSNVSDANLSTASSMSTTTGGTEVAQTTTATGTAVWVEVLSRSATIATVTAIGSPSDKGWVYSPGAGTFQTGNWSVSITLSASSPGTTDVTVRFYKLSGGVHTLIGTINKTGVVGAKTTYSFTPTSFSSVTFAAGDLLVRDVWWHDTSGADDNPVIYESNSATQGVVSDVVTTSVFIPAGTQTLHDVVMRGLVSQQTLHDIVMRGLVSQQVGKDVTMRGNVGAPPAPKDVVMRGNVSQGTAKDVKMRGNIGQLTSGRDIVMRGKPADTSTHDIVMRGKISGPRITSGGFTLFANGTGTATFASAFRATQYPDPALSLGPVLPRLGTSSVSWNANTATGTSAAMKTSLDGIHFSNATNGDPIPGLSGQADPAIDIFDGTASTSYTDTCKSGGAVAAVTADIANKRLILSGGSGALYLNESLVADDIDVICDMDESDAGGLVWRYQDGNNYYELGCYDDSSTSGFTSQLRLYKVSAGVRSLLGSASAVTWYRNTQGYSPYKRIRVTMLGAVITVYFDGTQVQQYTDASPLGAGQIGLRNDGGTSRYYQLRAQEQGDYVSGTPAGDVVSGTFVYLEQDLATTDPAVGPQVLDTTISARSPNIATGALITQLHDPTKPFAAKYSDEMTSLAEASGDYWWDVDEETGETLFAGREAQPAPFCLYSTDFLNKPATSSAGASGVQPTNSADTYRNQQIVNNTISLVTISGEEKIANGTDTSWNLAFPLHDAPEITVGGVVKTVGLKGVDTGKDFYWQPANNTISQDSGAAKIPSGYILTFSYVGQYADQVIENNLPEQAARKAVEGGTGIVVDIVDGQGMLSTNAVTYAQGLLARNDNNDTVSLIGTTTRPGLQQGMVVPVFLPEYGLNNRQLLIMRLTTSGYQKADGSTFYEYTITATDGPNLSNWAAALGL
jgi:hypothetical protein